MFTQIHKIHEKNWSYLSFPDFFFLNERWAVYYSVLNEINPICFFSQNSGKNNNIIDLLAFQNNHQVLNYGDSYEWFHVYIVFFFIYLLVTQTQCSAKILHSSLFLLTVLYDSSCTTSEPPIWRVVPHSGAYFCSSAEIVRYLFLKKGWMKPLV